MMSSFHHYILLYFYTFILSLSLFFKIYLFLSFQTEKLPEKYSFYFLAHLIPFEAFIDWIELSVCFSVF